MHVNSLLVASVFIFGATGLSAQQTPTQKDPNANRQQPQETVGLLVKATPQPPPTGGQSVATQPDENIAIQRDLAASTRDLARDTQKLADYTRGLLVVGAVVGVGQLFLIFFQLRYTA